MGVRGSHYPRRSHLDRAVVRARPCRDGRTAINHRDSPTVQTHKSRPNNPARTKPRTRPIIHVSPRTWVVHISQMGTVPLAMLDGSTPWPSPTAEAYLTERLWMAFPHHPTPFILRPQQLYSPPFSTHSNQYKWLTSITQTTLASTPSLEDPTRIHLRTGHLPLILRGQIIRCSLTQPISGSWSGGQGLWSGNRPAFRRQLAPVSVTQILLSIRG